MRKLGFLVAACGLLLGLSSKPGYADPVILDINGQSLGCAGCSTKIDINEIDLKPGNALAVGSLPLSGGSFQLYFQAAVNSFLLNNTTVFSPDLQSAGEVTAVAGFREQTTSVSGTTATFGFVAGGTNFFNLYYDSTRDADLDNTGVSFADGVQILGGSVVGANGSFTVNTSAPLVPLDTNTGNGGDTIETDGTIKTVTGNGSTTVNVQVTYLNPLFFSNNTPANLFDPLTGLVNGNLILSLDFRTLNDVPFSAANASNFFWNNVALFPRNIGTVNGQTGPDFQFQTDANGVFAVTAVPEPATLSLLGLGLLASAAARRRHQQKKAKQ